MSTNKTIAKNTMFLYFRMMFTMVVSLYTSRVILGVLGVDDFGLYSAVGGIVGFLSFINGALSNGTSRFLTYSLGEGDEAKLKRTFSTSLSVHVILAIIIVILSETVGLWFLYNKMVIPSDRMYAATWVFHISILTAFFSLTQTPYNATIISHEQMSVYAYSSIVEVVLKLLICYLIAASPIDKLISYAILLCIIQVGFILFYQWYCKKHYSETHFYIKNYDKSLVKQIFSFSSWSLIEAGSNAFCSQGIIILLNMFFAPAVVAARSISLTVYGAASSFVLNFRTAANPQIVKKYAEGDYLGSKNLLLDSTKYSYYLMFLIALPIFLLADPLLHLWLIEVPDYTTIFLQIVIAQSLFMAINTSLYTALYARGSIKENALVSPILFFLQFPLAYIFFKLGYSPVSLSWTNLVIFIILAVLVKPYLLIHFVGYHVVDFINLFKVCLRVTICALPLPIFVCTRVDTSSLLGFCAVVLTCIIVVGLTVWFLGVSAATRQKVITFIKSKL